MTLKSNENDLINQELLQYENVNKIENKLLLIYLNVAKRARAFSFIAFFISAYIQHQ